MKLLTEEIERFGDSFIPVTESGCWIWEKGVDKDGYGNFSTKARETIRAHRISYFIYKGEIPKGKMVLHTCDTPSCVNPNHLYIGDNYDNMRDRSVRGRGVFHTNEKHPACKFSNTEIKRILLLNGLGVSRKEIQEEFGISPSHLSSVISGRYRNVN